MSMIFRLFYEETMIPKSLKQSLALLVAEFFYCGRFPVAPGTAGSLGAMIIWVPMLYLAWPRWLILGLIVVLFGIGIWASAYGIEYYQQKDPKQVVIDEVVGVGIAFLVISPNWLEVASAFLLFRLFDIIKPWPIKHGENLPGAWGIMIDDVIAGIFSALVLLAIKLTKY